MRKKANAEIREICRPDPAPDADKEEPEEELIVDPGDFLSEAEVNELRLHIFKKHKLKQADIQRKQIITKVEGKSTPSGRKHNAYCRRMSGKVSILKEISIGNRLSSNASLAGINSCQPRLKDLASTMNHDTRRAHSKSAMSHAP